MLRGYKEITSWIEKRLGIPLTIPEACNYSRWIIDPLPVFRPWKGKQKRGMIYAKSEDVEAWARRHFKGVEGAH